MKDKYASKDNLKIANGMVKELRRMIEHARIDPQGVALLSEAEQKLVKFHSERERS